MNIKKVVKLLIRMMRYNNIILIQEQRKNDNTKINK
jgi:hypothetical protein